MKNINDETRSKLMHEFWQKAFDMDDFCEEYIETFTRVEDVDRLKLTSLEFHTVGNYSGHLQVKLVDGVAFWRVSCDVDYPTEWAHIPLCLFDALKR